LLKNGDLVIGNADIGAPAPSATTNLLIEVSPVVPGGFVGQPLQIDTGTPGAIFGIAATVDPAGHQIIYFNNDNNNANYFIIHIFFTSFPNKKYYKVWYKCNFFSASVLYVLICDFISSDC